MRPNRVCLWGIPFDVEDNGYVYEAGNFGAQKGFLAWDP
jgi:hypothetical protein